MTSDSFPVDPYVLFETWFHDAQSQEINDPNAMALATADSNGRPSVRYVLMRGYDVRGFRFFTNYESHKGHDLEQNPQAEANFYWKSIRKQIRIFGHVERLPPSESDAYFIARHRSSRIGACASRQSRPMNTYEDLQHSVAQAEKLYEGQDNIPRPDHWGGFLIRPESMEFWQDQPFRLHKRIVYTQNKDDAGWTLQWLYP